MLSPLREFVKSPGADDRGLPFCPRVGGENVRRNESGFLVLL